MDRFEARMDNLDRKVDGVGNELIEEIKRVDRKVEAMRDELSRKIDAYFRWTLGILIAGKP